ncbi:MAG: hypothetical protein R2741_08615 [Methanolobus sp.]
MKTKISILLFIIILISIVPAQADIMTPGMKSIDRCVKIANLNEFPDIVLIGYISGPVIQGENPYIITSNTCLTQFYKANDLTIYAIEKNYLDRVGIENINFETDSRILRYKMEIDPDSRTIGIANPLDSEDIYYSIAGFTEEGLVLYESKRVSSYAAGIDKVESFDEPEIENLKLNITEALDIDVPVEFNETEETGTKRSFVDTLVFFFNRLFGTRY